MPNLRGASPVSRGEGGRSYVARTVSEVSSRGKAVAARTKAQKCVGVARAGQTRQAQTRRMSSGKEGHVSTRSNVGSRLSYRGSSD